MSDDITRPDRDPAHLHPELRFRWVIISATMEHAGHPMRLVEGRRSTERQAWLYAQGRTREGLRVTKAPPGTSLHEPDDNGWGCAFDACFAGADPFSEDHPWDLYGQHVEAQGLEWGGRFKDPDRPHSQLPRPAPLS